MARVMRNEDGEVFEVYDSRRGAAYQEFLVFMSDQWLWQPTYMFSDLPDEHVRIIYVPNPESEEDKELPRIDKPSCEYFYPSILFPKGDPRRGCERAGTWAVWDEAKHSAEVSVACDKHVGSLLAQRGRHAKYHVWSLDENGNV